jgi:hypothetical protein
MVRAGNEIGPVCGFVNFSGLAKNPTLIFKKNRQMSTIQELKYPIITGIISKPFPVAADQPDPGSGMSWNHLGAKFVKVGGNFHEN